MLTISTVIYCDSVSFYLIVEKPHGSDVSMRKEKKGTAVVTFFRIFYSLYRLALDFLVKERSFF